MTVQPKVAIFINSYRTPRYRISVFIFQNHYYDDLLLNFKSADNVDSEKGVKEKNFMSRGEKSWKLINRTEN